MPLEMRAVSGSDASYHRRVENRTSLPHVSLVSPNKIRPFNAISHLELVTSYMVENLALNVRKPLHGISQDPYIQCWLDSAVAFYWISNSSEYLQYVTNQVRKIHSKVIQMLSGDMLPLVKSRQLSAVRGGVRPIDYG